MKKVFAAKPFHAFFKKRLQTQSYLDTEMSQSTTNLSSKILNSLKNAKSQLSTSNKKADAVTERLKTREKEEKTLRQTMRWKLEQKMRNSQTNMEKVMSERKKFSSSRSKFQSTVRTKIREKEKKQLEESLIRSKDYQTKTEDFFRKNEEKRILQFNRLQKLSPTYPYKKINDSKISDLSFYGSEARQSSVSRKKIDGKVLKINDSEIINKQKKKKYIQEEKETRYLEQYIQKMEEMEKIKNKAGLKEVKIPKATLPKVRQSQPEYTFSLTNFERQNKADKISKQRSFSVIYARKLKEKQGRRQEFHQQVLEDGNKILSREHQQSIKIKQNRLVKDAINQYKRWTNFVHSQR